MDPTEIRHFIDYDVACEILKAAGNVIRQRNKYITEEHRRKRKLRAAKLVTFWKQNHVPISVFNRLKSSTISKFSLMAHVPNQLNTEPMQTSSSNETEEGIVIELFTESLYSVFLYSEVVCQWLFLPTQTYF
jgi:hypothetical protein